MRISFWPDANQPWEDVSSLAQHVEAKGWDGIWYADHFMPDAQDTSEPCNEMWSTLARAGGQGAEGSYRLHGFL